MESGPDVGPQAPAVSRKARAPTALTVSCGVCSAPAPDHIHFGARCCYSCRAFFRRRAIRRDKLRCRSSVGSSVGDCEVRENSKKCIACRYQRCILIGMDPALVQGARKRQRKNDSTEDEEEGDDETPERGELKESPEPIPSTAGAAGPKPLQSSFSFPFITTTPITKPDLTSPPLLKTPPVPQRPSVIKRAMRDGSAKLQMQADILKFHGNILTHTGNLFSYHADLINKDKPDTSAETGPGVIKQEIKQEEGGNCGSFQRQQSAPAHSQYLALKEEQSRGEQEEFSDVLADKIFEEAQELIQNSPWILEPETVSYVESGVGGPEISKANILNWLQATTSGSDGRNTEPVVTSVPSHHRSVIQSRETKQF